MGDLLLEWDGAKAQANLRKHRISFVLAGLVFEDPAYVEIKDEKHSATEERHLAIGEIEGACVTVVFTRRGKALRLISARPSSRLERKLYRESTAP
jgi:uncharacterized DUF497 family protein